MPKNQRGLCCVCHTKSSCKFVAADSYLPDFGFCFRLHHVQHPGDTLCNTCRSAVVDYRVNKRKIPAIIKDFSHLVCSKGEPYQKKNLVKRRKLYFKSTNKVSVSEQSKHLTSLTDLPTVILLYIAEYLPLQDYQSFVSTCKLTREIGLFNTFWRGVFQRSFPNYKLNLPEGVPWLTAVKLAFKLQRQTTKLVESNTLLNQKVSEYAQKFGYMKTQLNNAEEKYLKLLNNNCPFDAEKTMVLRELVRQKQTTDGILVIENERGRPKTFVSLTVAEKGSSTASGSTVRRRSAEAEKVEKLLCTPSNSNEDLIKQRTSVIRRDVESFQEAAKHAGLKVLHKFSLKTVFGLKSQMPWEMVRMLKRTFITEFGVDVFGAEPAIREHVKQFEHEFESGTFQTVGKDGQEKTAHFLRVAHFGDVLKTMVGQMHDKDELTTYSNISKNTLWLLVCGDKGGGTTKLIMQILNCKVQHSIKHATLLGIFEGAKDDYYNIKQVFGPIYDQIHLTLKNLKDH